MKNVIDTISLLIACIAIILSYQTYLRQKTFENENHLFKYKFDKYNEILAKIRQILFFIEDEIHEFYISWEARTMTKDEIDEIFDDFDSKIGETEFELFSNSAFLPEKVVNEIDDFIDKIYTADFLKNHKTVDYDSELKKFDEVADCIFEIAEVMREDLGIDPLNKKLHKRTRK